MARIKTETLPLTSALDSLSDERTWQLERTYPADMLLVPPVVELDGERLVWRFGEKVQPPFKPLVVPGATFVESSRDYWGVKLVPPGKGVLRQFVGLADASPDRILAYARRWGVLGICDQHGLPGNHPGPRVRDGKVEYCWPCGWDGRSGWDPLLAWRQHADDARRILLLASRTRDADAPYAPHSDWEQLAIRVNFWLSWGNVRPWLVAPGRGDIARLRLVFASEWQIVNPEFPLFGVLGMQLAFAVLGERGLIACSYCGNLFEPKRRPRPNQNHPCERCGRRAMNRENKRRQRERERVREHG